MTKEQLLRIENKVDNLSNQVSGLYAQINHQKDDLSNQLIAKIKEWLQDEINTYQEIQTRISDGEEIENIADAPEVFFGRSECAEGLLSKIEEWEDGNE